MGDIAKAATVSLIDTGTNTTVATTWTDSEGGFNLAFPQGFVPKADHPYVLEGIKGLSSNLPGNDAVRVRTLARLRSGAWETITLGMVTINPSTTALAIMEASYQDARKPGQMSDPLQYFNLVAQVSNSFGTPDTLAAGQTVVSQTTYAEVYGYVASAITKNVDSVAAVEYVKTADSFVPLKLDATKPSITGVFPLAAVRGAEITVFGTNFQNDEESNEVYVAGYRAEVTQASQTQLVFKIPAAAVTGDLLVITGDGPSNKVQLAVFPDPSGYFEP